MMESVTWDIGMNFFTVSITAALHMMSAYVGNLKLHDLVKL